MSLEIGNFSTLRKITQSNPRNQKSGDLDKNSKSNRSLKLDEIFVSKNN